MVKTVAVPEFDLRGGGVKNLSNGGWDRKALKVLTVEVPAFLPSIISFY